MEILTSKWLVGAVVLVLILLILLALGRKEVHTELVIPATPSDIWAVLVDASGYREWNPVLVPIEGSLAQGAKLRYEMTQPNGSTSVVTSRVIRFAEEQELNQRGGVPGVLTFDHHWVLTPVEGGTRVTQYERYRGIGVPFWNPGWVEVAYREANEALRDRVVALGEPG